MNSLEWTHYQVFTTTKDKGNPAAVLFLLEALTTKQQQAIAKGINFNETVFISKDSDADFYFRFFAPETEMEFCGHALLATDKNIYSIMGEIKPAERKPYIHRTKK